MSGVLKWAVLVLALALPATGWADVVQPAANDPGAAGIQAVNAAAEVLKSQSPDAAIAYFTDVLNQSRNGSVQRAIRFQLVDLYKQAGRTDKELEVLKDLMISIPPIPQPTVVQLESPAAAQGQGQ